MSSRRVFVDLRFRGNTEGVLGDFSTLTTLLNDHGLVLDEDNKMEEDSGTDIQTPETRNSGNVTPENGQANHLPQANKHSRKSKKRANSQSLASQPASKRRRLGEDAEPSPPALETLTIEHHIDIHYYNSYEKSSTPPHIRRLLQALEGAWNRKSTPLTVPICMRSPKGSQTANLVGVLDKSIRPSARVDPAQVFVTLPKFDDPSMIHDYNFTAKQSDVLRAILELESSRRAIVELSMAISPNPSDLMETLPDYLDPDELVFTLSISIRTTLVNIDEEIEPSQAALEAQRRLLLEYFPLPDTAQCAIPTVPNFIAGLQPAPALPRTILPEFVQPKDLKCQLYPFQGRTVFWMLGREGFTLSSSGNVIRSTAHEPVRFWDQVALPSGSTRFFNRLTGELKKEDDIETYPPIRGGILAEEVGCGKTVECIALMLLNPPKKRGPYNVNWNDDAQIPLHEVKTTLIVTPPSLQKQWIEEIAKHAPSLKVFVFDSWKVLWDHIGRSDVRKKNSKASETSPSEDWANFCQGYDVVITTYNTLAQELNVARGAVSRPRRETAEYGERSLPRSPLIMVEFWRVIMDEVQMSGGINTVQMVSLIPRINSFAVSGTPARATVADLLHVLAFLRAPLFITSNRIWNRLLSPAYFETFKSLFDTSLAVRTSKAQVKNEFQLPAQTRYIVPIDFGRIERTIYDDILETALQQLHVDSRGVAAHAGWEMDLSSLRSWLQKLRQVCTHPQVSGISKIDRIIGGRGIKSMDEVLEVMRETTRSQLIIDQRKKINLDIRHSQLLALTPEMDDKLRLRILSIQVPALEAVQAMVQESEVDIKAHRQLGIKGLEEAVTRERERKQKLAESRDGNQDQTAKKKGKGKARAKSLDSINSSDDESDTGSDSDDEGGIGRSIDIFEDDDEKKRSKAWQKRWRWWHKTEKGKEWRHHHGALIMRRRENMILMHKIQLLLGDINFQLKQEEQEKQYYNEAEQIRVKLLAASEKTAVDAMTALPSQLEQIATKNAPGTTGVDAPTLQNLLIEDPPKPGILTEAPFELEQDVIDVLNEQTELLFQWKDHIVSLLTQRLVEDSNPDDEITPYERALEVQTECEAYLKAYQSLLADRREALNAERTLLAAAESRPSKLRKTKVSKALREEEELAGDPVRDQILKDLDSERRELTKRLGGKALKSVLVRLTEIVNTEGTRREEVAIAKIEAARLKQLINVQAKQMERLDKQLAPIRNVFNDRIEYFRQLQAINDSVMPVDLDGHETLDEAIEECLEELSTAEKSLNARQARQRYLTGIVNAEEDEDEEHTCVLCKCEFQKGVMLGCVHHFCEDCILMWMAKTTNKFCPVCRAPIEKDAIQRIHVGKDASAEVEVEMSELQQRRSKDLENYNVMPEKTIAEILDMDVVADKHGSKIMFLVKHLLWLEREDPGAKAVVFSSWAGSLSIIADAFDHNGIRYIRIDAIGKKSNPVHEFETNPELQVLLLHGERDVSGLNITCACRCLIVEPTVNHNFEVQAIARIDRMGQTRETEVENSIERNILDLGARQGLSLYTKDNATAAMDVNKLQRGKEKVDAPARTKKSGDFIASGDDMLAIMFPHLYDQSGAFMDEVAIFEESMDDAAPSGYGESAVAGSSELMSIETS